MKYSGQNIHRINTDFGIINTCCQYQFYDQELNKDPMSKRIDRLRDVGSGKELAPGRGHDGRTPWKRWGKYQCGRDSQAGSVRTLMAP